MADQVLENIHMPKLTVTGHSTKQIILQHTASRDQSRQKYNRCKQRKDSDLFLTDTNFIFGIGHEIHGTRLK